MADEQDELDARRKLVGERVRRARNAMRPTTTIDEASSRAPMGSATWRNVEVGIKAKPFSYAAIERVLDWPAGTISHYLETGDEAVLPSVRLESADDRIIDAALRSALDDSTKVGVIEAVRFGNGDPTGYILELDADATRRRVLYDAFKTLETSVREPAREES